ncbi:flavin reductase family protein [Paenibacillus durus]|uniref:Flavin reductase like domain-containing protein n=1 Tax=Paenibacillus durus ATCC 35681 TaxID=1333534 RepID=A0A0F7F7F1_PAEDU|nr:flavin reductase family protein [Paenibacillus durus]AKG33857.1 hypothetical protein VK70_04030 [Paenibacillus durus ATCC 35681]
MKKVDAKVALSPIPLVVIGSEFDGKVNYITVAYTGLLDSQTILVSLGKIQYSNKGLKENMTMSINIPSEEMVAKADYVGLVSGAKVDKSSVFESFYGDLKGAPMIKGASACMECEVVEIIEMPNHNVYVCKVKNTYWNENSLIENNVDISLAKPLLFDIYQRKYLKVGDVLADAWSIGKSLL